MEKQKKNFCEHLDRDLNPTLVCQGSTVDASASSQVSPNLCGSFLTAPFQFVVGHPGPLLNLEPSSTVVCADDPSVFRDKASTAYFSILYCPVLALTSSCVSLPFQKTCNSLCFFAAASSLFISVVNGHDSAPYKTGDKIRE